MAQVKRTVLLVIAGLVLIGARSTSTSSGYVNAYVAYDRDGDKQASVGDEMRWFVAASADTTVAMTCWSDKTKAVQVQSYTNSFSTPLTGYGTPSGVTLTSAGYCESSGVTSSGGSVGVVGWFPVAP